MQAIKGKNTSIEIALRQELWKRGYRYRKNCNIVYGHPDLAFIGKKVAVFVTVNFGMVLTGITEKIQYGLILNFGLLKSNGTSNVIQKLIRN